jgi:hypothetical protein
LTLLPSRNGDQVKHKRASSKKLSRLLQASYLLDATRWHGDTQSNNSTPWFSRAG